MSTVPALCPFCGQYPQTVATYSHGPYRQCVNHLCPVVRVRFDPDRWNTRPNEDALRARAEAAEAALATARAEGAAAERAAVLGALRGQLAYAAPRGWPEAVEMLEECIEDIEAGAHVRPVEGA